MLITIGLPLAIVGGLLFFYSRRKLRSIPADVVRPRGTSGLLYLGGYLAFLGSVALLTAAAGYPASQYGVFEICFSATTGLMAYMLMSYDRHSRQELAAASAKRATDLADSAMVAKAAADTGHTSRQVA